MSTAAADAAGLEAVEEEAAPPQPQAILNQRNRRLVITGSDGTTFALAPLESRAVSPELIEALAPELRALENLNYVKLEYPPEERESWLPTALGVGVWVVIGSIVLGVWLDWVWYWPLAGVALLLAAIIMWRASASGAAERWVALTGVLVLVIAAGVGFPGAIIWFGGNVREVLDVALYGEDAAQEEAIFTILGRALQVVFIALVSLLPGLLYFLFDRARLTTLRERFIRQIFRLDRTLQTEADVAAKYGPVVEESYGAPARAGTRLQPGTQWPILLATITMAFGWSLVVLNPSVEIVQGVDFRTLFRPVETAPAFAFLGGYVFSLTVILRGFVRGDLRPKTYGYIAVRIVIVIVIAWVLEVVMDPGDTLLVTAFLAGFVPDTVLYRLREVTRWVGSIFQDRWPLTDLDGVDLYERARLEAEGVTNVQALAKHDLVDLVLQTRIPVPRLVDWVDQAILQLHVADKEGMKVLRRNGIRTATRLEVVHAKASDRGEEDELLSLLGSDEGGPPRLCGVLAAIKDEEWMDAIRYWRLPPQKSEETVRFPLDPMMSPADQPA